MNIKDYIESGIVATYVLGLATEAEQKEFESLCKQYPELNEAKRSFELALEDQLLKEAVLVPEGLKERVLGSLKKSPGNNMHRTEREHKTPLRKMNVWKRATVLCILLLLTGSVYFTYFLREKYQKLQKENAELKYSLEKSSYTNPLLAVNPIIQKPSVKWAAMIEPKNSSHCLAHVYWDSVSAKTFLLIGNIPQPLSERHFHLWALSDNQAVDLGVFDIKKQCQLIQMKNVLKATTFIITIEPKGRSLAPSMQAMYATGKL